MFSVLVRVFRYKISPCGGANLDFHALKITDAARLLISQLCRHSKLTLVRMARLS